MTEPDDTVDKPVQNLGGPGGTGLAAPPPQGFKHGMRAFQYRDFRIFFAGALASNTGNWLQNLAVPFVLFELTGKALWVGLAGFAQFIPAFFLGPVGGSLADRRNRKNVLMFSQFGMAVSAFMLWIAWVLNYREPLLILLLTALTGIFSGIMIPSWQAFVPSLVPRSALASAITLNSTQFNASRAIGPALAGFLLATAGASTAFFLNGVSFVAVIGAIWMVNPIVAERRAATTTTVLQGFGEAIVYIRRRQGILLSMLCAILVAFFGNPITQFTVVFAQDVYNSGPRVLGLLAAAVGIGAVLIAPALSTWDTRIPRSSVVRWGLPFYALAVIAFGVAPNWPLGVIALLMVGAGFLLVIATTNTAVQLMVDEEMRGRVMSARVMSFTLAFPLGSLLQGYLSDIWGPQATVVVMGAILLGLAILVATQPTWLLTLDEE
ncbi:MAG: MFS family permease [Acidimicrobiales bacterium]